MQPIPAIVGQQCRCGAIVPRLHREHIIPKWAGGGNGPDNIQYICPNCHAWKTAQERHLYPEAWAKRLDLVRQGAAKGRAASQARDPGSALASSVSGGKVGATYPRRRPRLPKVPYTPLPPEERHRRMVEGGRKGAQARAKKYPKKTTTPYTRLPPEERHLRLVEAGRRGAQARKDRKAAQD